MCLAGIQVVRNKLCKCNKKKETKTFQRQKLINSLMLFITVVLLSSKDILCESHNAIHFQHLRCVLCTQRHHIVPLGAANRFVWPGSLFCLSSLSPLSLSLSLLLSSPLLPSYPLPPPWSQNLILKKDY